MKLSLNFAWRAAAAVCTLVLVFALGACGNGSGGSSSGSGLTRISVGNFPNTLLTLPLGVAQGEGLFTAEGLAVKVVPATGGPQLLSAMLGGTTQFTPVPASVAMAAMAQGQDLRVLPPFEQENSVIAAPTDSNIKTMADLVGKRVAVAVRGGAAEIFASAVLKEDGIDPGGVTFVATGTATTMSAALSNHRVDALVASNATVAALAQQTKMTILASALDGSAGERGKAGIASFYVTTPKYYDSNKGTTEKFCTALTKAATWIAADSNREKALNYIQQWTGITNKATVDSLYAAEHKSWLEQLDAHRWSANVAFNAPGKSIAYTSVTPSCG